MRNRLVMGLAGLLVLAAAVWGGYRFLGFGSGATEFGSVEKYVFVANAAAAEVSVIDAAEDKIAGVLALPFVADQLLVSRAIMRLVVMNRAERLVALVDLPSGAVEHRFELGISPDLMVLSPDGLRLAVADAAAGKVALISLIDNTVTAVIEGLNSPEKLTFSAEGVVLFVADDVAAEIRRISVTKSETLAPLSLREAGVVPGAAEISALTRTPDGRMGFVTDAVGGKGYVINLRDWEVTKTISLGNSPSRAYGTADGVYLMVANTGSRTISVIATDRFDVVATLPGVGDITSIATGFFETLAYVVSRDEKKAVVIDLETLTVAGEVALEGVPGQAIADVDGKKLYVPLAGVGKLALIDVFNKRIGHMITGTAVAPGAPVMAASNNYCH
ncbi:YncE family protein [Phaeovulum sp.]|uniref:YncE family protein n=1 Tax=Phaeovulum sp. TaxID=2934796 RepID=UPI00273211C9|nr:YncE family protein [Phaeovulum sp.]MDP1667780.1 YncE family protein [Phaeovulum sp.]MDZ4119741.1 YncE family protein [Phaeovulum sp.]